MKIFPCFDWCIAHGGLWGRCFATLGVDFIHCSYIFVSVSQEDWTWEGDQEVGARGVSFWPWSDFWRLRALGRAKQEVNGGSLFRGGERLWRMWTWRGFQDWALKLALGCAVCFIYWRPGGGQCHGDTGVKHLSWFMETLHWRERFW